MNLETTRPLTMIKYNIYPMRIALTRMLLRF